MQSYYTKDLEALALGREGPGRCPWAKELAEESVNHSKYELCSQDSSQALGGQGLSHRCRGDGTTGQVSVLHTAKGTGGYPALCSSLIPFDNFCRNWQRVKGENWAGYLISTTPDCWLALFREKYKQLLGLVQSACFSLIISASCHQAGEFWDCWDLAALPPFAGKRMHFSRISDISAELRGSGVLQGQPVDEAGLFAGCLAAETCC